MDAEAGVLNLPRNFFCVFLEFTAYGKHRYLHRSEPRRECARVMFDQHAEKSFDRAKECAMDHQRLVARPVSPRTRARTPREIEIELYGRELPRAANRVDEFHSISDRRMRPRRECICKVRSCASKCWRAHLRAFPSWECRRRFPDATRRRPKDPLRICETENAQHLPGELNAVFNFLFDLFGHAEDVRIILGEAANSQPDVKDAGALIAIDGAKLGKPDGKLAITSQVRFENKECGPGHSWV